MTISNISLTTTTKGDIAEYRAIVRLLEQGLEVYRNVTSDGPVDLVTLNRETGEVTLVDVKQMTEGRSNGAGRTAEQKRLGVKILYIDSGFRWSAANDNQKEDQDNGE